ncbi:MAG: TerB family tellurite resistance protein [Odoribacteraceae bacterium]|jgi:DnaJ like chaperone protein|nr:TerB family tellurite resistance protein [Odoribacteraceae bacterium]
MAGFIAIIVAVIGYLVAGFGGAILGYFLGLSLGAFIEWLVNMASTPAHDQQTTGQREFLKNLVILAAAIMKADGKIKRNELMYARRFFREHFGEAGEREALAIIRDLLNKEINVEGVCARIRYNMQEQARVQLLYFLFGIAGADGNVCAREVALLDRIAPLLGLDDTTYRSIKSMFYKEVDSAYTILGIPATATDEEVKKAYRKAALEHHPDRVGYMGENIRKAAGEKFAAINAAYEKIKRDRGL